MTTTTTSMPPPPPPPPPRNPNPNQNPSPPLASSPPPEQQQEEEKPDSENPNHSSDSEQQQKAGAGVPYRIPEWSSAPTHPFSLEVLKDGVIIQQLDVSKKGAYMFGRIDLCDFMLEHPTISRFHAVLQFKQDLVFLYDLGSTHGTFINKNQVKKKVYTEIHVGDVIKFGLSSRLYIFQGPSGLMPPEGDMQRLRDAKVRREMMDREASLLRAKTEAASAEGISWGMSEDAVEETMENDEDEITWQTYRGQLTERQEKTRSKIVKRLEKVANMKKEIDAIRVKDIAQGGLTQGQQTQIARNEQRMSQIMEELDNLEETLNDSIRESLGARSAKVTHGRKKEVPEEDDGFMSDDDEFYDRTKKKASVQKSSEQSVETADTLLEKKDIITNDMEAKRKLLEDEKNRLEEGGSTDDGDDLDAYMSGLSSQLVQDRIIRIQKEISDLQAELDKVIYLLKIADPVGEAARKRDAKPREPKILPIVDTKNTTAPKHKESAAQSRTSLVDEKFKESSYVKQEDKPVEAKKEVPKNNEDGKPAFALTKPQWLGDVQRTEPTENSMQEEAGDAAEPDNFVDYKDRKTVLAKLDAEKDLENAAPGLIIRKRKHVDKPTTTLDEATGVAVPSAADAVALLLKHKRGYHALDEMQDDDQLQSVDKGEKPSQPKRVLGPSRPDFLNAGPGYESWVPPKGQTGDGRTALNDRLGY